MSNPNSSCEEPDGCAPCIVKRKRNPPGHPDPDAKVIALSPRTLMATNRFVCEICSKGFQRDQNLQLHRRGHNLPWRLKQKASLEVKKVYICPEESCVHHDPTRALGDLTGIKKHFSRKHGEKRWKCDKCSKRYAVLSDWKAHQKTCGTREYRCDCGVLFSRRDSFSTHRAFCDALAEESTKIYMLRQGDSRKTARDSNCDVASFIGDLSTAMKASSSPTSQITRDALAAYTDVSEPPFTYERALNLAFPEGTTASPWMPPAGHSSIRPTVPLTKSPGRLSLYLGMGPGPGPQGCSPNLSGTGSPFDFPSLEALNKLAFPHAASTQGYDTYLQSSSPMVGALGMLPSIASSPKPTHAPREIGDDMFGILGYPDISQLDEPAMRQVSAGSSSRGRSTSALISTISGSGIQSKPSSHHAVSSATALLQKAAQMGATASSKPSLLQRFGVGGMGETMEVQDMQHRQPSWPGVSSMFSSPNTQAGEVYKNDGGPDGPVSASCATKICETGSRFGSMEELMNSVSAGRNGLLKNAGVDRIPPSTGSIAVQKPSSSSLIAPAGMHSLPREELKREAPMVDFLGVGSSLFRSSSQKSWCLEPVRRNHGD